jgi:tRNA threonylcarbamoyl adenosine modification protein YeaZ
MSFCLSVDLSTPTGTLAIHDRAGSLVDEATLGEGYKHSEKLIGALDSLLQSKGFGLEQFTRFVCPFGPGSFTGLRIGMATLKAFALVFGVRLDAMSASEARAHGYVSGTSLEKKATIAVLTHVGSRRMVEARFAISENLNPILVSEKSLDISEWIIPSDNTLVLSDRIGPEAIYFPSRAKYFVPALSSSQTLISADTPQGYAQIQPVYFGSRTSEASTIGDGATTTP